MEISQRLFDVFEIRDGRVMRIREYLDRDEALEAAGLPGAPQAQDAPFQAPAGCLREEADSYAAPQPVSDMEVADVSVSCRQ